MTRTELKQEAKDVLRGNWTWAILISILGTILADLIDSLTVGIIGYIVYFGVMFTFLDMIDGKKESNYFTAIFSAFTNRRFIPSLLTSLLSTIFITLWTFLLIVPGIIKSYSYAMAPYIVKDLVDSGQECSPTEAITLSKQLMDGHKFELFVLDLSFIGWSIVGVLTLGIGYLWIIPYILTTKAAYYRSIAGDKFGYGVVVN